MFSLISWVGDLYRTMHCHLQDGAHYSASLNVTLFEILSITNLPLPDALSRHPPHTHFGEKLNTENSSILGSFCRFHQACKKHTCCAVWFSDHRLLTKSEGGKKDFYQTLFTGQWIFFTIWMYLWNAWVIHYSRFWSMTMGRRNDSDVSFSWFTLILFIPWPVYLD